MKTLLPTSTAGSLPKPVWLAEPETLWSPWKLQGDDLIEAKQDALRLSLDDQRRAGIDIVSDGEQTRQHFVTTFIEHLDGVDFENRKTMRIRNRYDASVPVVVGAVSRPKSVFVEDAKFLRAQTDQPIKWALPGPMTMIDTLYDDHYGKLMGKAAFVTATRHAREVMVMAATNRIDFKAPIDGGDMVELVSRVKMVGRSALSVEVQLWAERLLTGERRRSTTAEFVMVAVDDAAKPKTIKAGRTSDEVGAR